MAVLTAHGNVQFCGAYMSATWNQGEICGIAVSNNFIANGNDS